MGIRWARLMGDPFLDCTSWQAMLDREDLPASDAHVGVLKREAFASRHGKLLVWRGTMDGVRVSLREYSGEPGADVAVLLVADDEAVQALLAEGLPKLPLLVRRGKLHPYMLMAMEQLEDNGLADLVEDLGLAFPKH